MSWDVTGKYKRVEVEKQDGTLLPKDEPVFVLRAQDILAPIAVDYYARLFELATGDAHHAHELRSFAKVMTAWHPRKLPD